MPDKEAPMTDQEIAALKAARDLGLPEPDLDRVTATVSAALDQEYEAEREQGQVRRGGGKKRRRKRLAVIASVALVVGGLATAGYAALNGSSTASDGIGCYSGEEIGGSVTIVSLDGRRATKTCAELWAAGDVNGPQRKAPAPFHACVSNEGGGPIRVFSSTDESICSRLGMVEDPDAGSDPDARRFGRFMSQLLPRLGAKREDLYCDGYEYVRQLVERGLAEHELNDWTIVESGEFNQVNQCGSVAFDSDALTVTVFAEPMIPGQVAARP